MILKNFSQNQDYDFELFENNLGYFKKRAIIQSKLQENKNTLFFIEDNKVLSVYVDNENEWFYYSKAMFLANVFQIDKTNKYVLINENNDFCYGYIDGFPCVFQNTESRVENILKEYMEDEIFEIEKYGFGNVVGDEYLKIITCKAVAKMFNKENGNLSYVMEDTEEYSVNNNIQIEKLFLQWYNSVQKKEVNYKNKIFICCLLSVCLIVASYYLNSL